MMDIVTGVFGWIIFAVLGLVFLMMMPVILFSFFFFKKVENILKRQAIYMQQVFRPDLNDRKKVP